MTVTRSPSAKSVSRGGDDLGEDLVPDDPAAGDTMVEMPLIDV